jgi:serine/threonine protein kinase
MTLPQEPPIAITPGDVLDEKYAVEEVLGTGGMGVVVAATHLTLGRRVALKLLHAEACQNEATVSRFLREARTAARMKSEHVARVMDVGKLQGGVPFIVMEYLEGRDLAHELKERSRVPADEAVGYVLQACEAVCEAHSLGIVHRDLKPANLFLTRQVDGSPMIKVLDFGISKLLEHPPGSDGDLSLTATAGFMGSPLYVSPEQAQDSSDVDVRTDVWSLGAILYELVAGRPPFEAKSLAGLLTVLLSTRPNPLTRVQPDTPEGLSAVAARCLERDLEQRYQHIGELVEALTPFAPEWTQPTISRVRGIVARSRRSEADQAKDLPERVDPLLGTVREGRDESSSEQPQQHTEDEGVEAERPAPLPHATASEFSRTASKASPRHPWRWYALAAIAAGLGLLALGVILLSTSRRLSNGGDSRPAAATDSVMVQPSAGEYGSSGHEQQSAGGAAEPVPLAGDRLAPAASAGGEAGPERQSAGHRVDAPRAKTSTSTAAAQAGSDIARQRASAPHSASATRKARDPAGLRPRPVSSSVLRDAPSPWDRK